MKWGPLVRQGLLAATLLGGSAAFAAVLVATRKAAEPDQVTVDPPLVDVLEVQLVRRQLDVAALGDLVPRREATLSSQVAGRVLELAPELVVGGPVEEGCVLARLDRSDLEVAQLMAEASLAEANASLELEQAEADQAVADWKRVGQSGEAPALARRAPQLARAKAAVAAARAGLERATLDLARTELRAPFTGYVRRVDVGIGEYVTPGVALAELYQSTPMELRVSLSDRELAQLDLTELLAGDGPGPEVVVETTFAGVRSRWSGRVVRLDGEVDPVSRMARLVAEIDRPINGDVRAPLLAGLFVRATLAGRTLEQAAILPRRALVGPREVLVIGPEDRLDRRNVEVAWAGRDEVVVSSGLADGERVVVSPIDAPIEGMHVRLTNGSDAGIDAGSDASSDAARDAARDAGNESGTGQ